MQVNLQIARVTGLVSLFAALLCADVLFKAPPAQSAYQEGLKQLAANRLDMAEKAFRRSIELSPKQAASLIGLADVAARQGKPKEALALCQKAIAMEPKNAGAHGAMSRFLAQQGRKQEAIASMKKAVSLQPGSATLWVEYGDLMARALKQPKEAANLYQKAIDIDPNNAAAHFALGHARRELGDLALAKKEWRDAARLAPDNPLSYVALGETQIHEKDYKGAIESFDAALKVNPDLIPGIAGKGESCLRSSDFPQAIRMFEKAANLAPRNTLVRTKLGMAHQGAGNRDEARKHYLAAIEMDPKAVPAFNNLAWMAAEDGKNLDQALGWANKAIQLAPGNPQLYDTLGWVHRARKEKSQAISALTTASASRQVSPVTLYHLGIVHEESGNTQAARAALTKALEISRDFPGARDAERRLASYR